MSSTVWQYVVLAWRPVTEAIQMDSVLFIYLYIYICEWNLFSPAKSTHGRSDIGKMIEVRTAPWDTNECVAAAAAPTNVSEICRWPLVSSAKQRSMDTLMGTTHHPIVVNIYQARRTHQQSTLFANIQHETTKWIWLDNNRATRASANYTKETQTKKRRKKNMQTYNHISYNQHVLWIWIGVFRIPKPSCRGSRGPRFPHRFHGSDRSNVQKPHQD